MAKNPTFNKNGIIVIDKPAGITSAQVVSRVKRITGAKKVGHTGTLDPFATGLMICGINGGTRLSQFFLSGDKTYEAGLLLGSDTDTMDCTGAVVSNCDENFFSNSDDQYDSDFFNSLFKTFVGKQSQLPPVYSALKHNGVPLYKLARKGTPVQKPPRNITIYSLRLIMHSLPSVLFEVSCSTGTYIRTLASDIGKRVGSGGHLFSLRRTETSGFKIKDSVTLEKLEAAENPGSFLISMDKALPHMASHIASEQLEAKISNGVGINVNDGIDIDQKGEDDFFIKVLSRDGHVIAILNYLKCSEKYNYCCVFHN